MTRQKPSSETPEQQTLRLLEAVRKLLVAGLAAFTVSIVTSVAIYFNADNDDEAIDQTRENSSEVKEFVDDLQEVTPAEEAQNAAVTEAVQEVPRLRQILCSPEAFPEAAACQDGS